MFDFGDPVDTAKLVWGRSLSRTGPSVPEVPYDEMGEQDLRNAFTYLYMSVADGLREGVGASVVQVLLDEYDFVFELLAEVSDDFREAVRSNRHSPVTGYSKESVDKYKRLARV